MSDFKGAVCNILVATSVAARGLDVKDLVLVLNFDTPNHHEDYVHRSVNATVTLRIPPLRNQYSDVGYGLMLCCLHDHSW